MRCLFSVLLILIACEEEPVEPCTPIADYPIRQIYVDAECNPVTREAITRAIEKANDFTNEMICQDTIELIGELEVYDKEDIKPDTDNLDVFVCYNNEPEWFNDSKYESWFGSSSRYKRFTVIRLFLFWTPEGLYESLIMHELIHYIGISGHTENSNAVMYKNINRQYYYTKADREFFKDKIGVE